MTTVSEWSDNFHDDFVGQTVKRLCQERPKSTEVCVDGTRWGEVEGEDGGGGGGCGGEPVTTAAPSPPRQSFCIQIGRDATFSSLRGGA